MENYSHITHLLSQILWCLREMRAMQMRILQLSHDDLTKLVREYHSENDEIKTHKK